MKRFLLWLFTVLLLTGIVVLSFLGFLYWRADKSALPKAEITFGGQPLDTSAGYRWKLPILGGILWREHTLSPGLAYQNLATPIATTTPTLSLGDGLSAAASKLTVTSAGGTKVFEGTAAEWGSFAFAQNGEYSLVLQAGQGVSNKKPTPPVGHYQYQYRFSVQVEPRLLVSDSSAAQGSVLALQVNGILDAGAAPKADCDLGPVWFHETELGWVGYLPITYNATGGSHDITVTVGDTTLKSSVEVYGREWPSVQNVAVSGGSSEANEQFKNAIWGLYNRGSGDVFWTGAFLAPANNAGRLQPYGAYLYTDGGASAGRAAGITYACGNGTQIISPAGGTIVYKGALSLTGGTLVIDHGCGVKSYLFGLSELPQAPENSSIIAGEVLGTADGPLIWEVRIGNKSIDPSALLKNSGGLFYRPRA